jgi:hypothetical protein
MKKTTLPKNSKGARVLILNPQISQITPITIEKGKVFTNASTDFN